MLESTTSTSSVSGDAPISAFAPQHTIQAFIELVYVQTANSVLVSQMASLNNALGITKEGIDALTTIQNLKNAVTIENRTPPSVPSGISEDTYKQQATAAFAQPLQVLVSYSGYTGGSVGYKARLAQAKATLSGLIPHLESVTPKVNGQIDSTSLLAKIQVVLSDLNSTNATANPAAWLQDNYNTSSTTSTNQGTYQQHITDAITAGQSLNTTQTESVRNFLYLFEEYYKSASAVLSAISQIISKMAGGISR